MFNKLKSPLRRATTITLAFVFLLTGCSNIYAPLANKTSDEARYEDAKKLLNAESYDAAVDAFDLLSDDFLQGVEVRELYASALAGKCGFNFAGFLNFLAAADFSTTPFFHSLMNQFTARIVRPQYCTDAENMMKSIWVSHTPTSSQQFFMVMLSMSKIGAYLRNKADIDGTGSLGDGTPDAGFDVCSSADPNLSDAEVAELVTGFSSMLLNITGFIGSFSGGTGSAITSIQTACGLMTPNPCATVDAANVTAPMIDSMRELLATNVNYTPMPLGIGSCTLPTPPGSCCP